MRGPAEEHEAVQRRERWPLAVSGGRRLDGVVGIHAMFGELRFRLQEQVLLGTNLTFLLTHGVIRSMLATFPEVPISKDMHVKIHHISGRGVATIPHQNTAAQIAPGPTARWSNVAAASAVLLTEDGQSGATTASAASPAERASG